MNILFVCTGNTCRSPMAEALLKYKMPEVNVQSAGIFASNNLHANRLAIQSLEERGIQCEHLSQPVTEQLLSWADVVLTMTTQHKQSLIIDFPHYQNNFYTLKEYVSEADKQVWQNDDISDPFGRSLEVYRETLNELENHIDLLITKLRK